MKRFWSKVSKTDNCWLWRASVDGNGYGKFWLSGKIQRAPRVAFYLTRGHWPNVCRHTCDNPLCVNPEHLLDGTMKDNTADAWSRGRLPRPPRLCGENSPRAKLTFDDVLWMRWARQYAGVSYQKLADAFGVSLSPAHRAVNGECWKAKG